MQNAHFNKVLIPHKKISKTWRSFAEQLKNQIVGTIVDFNDSIHTKHKASIDLKHAKYLVYDKEKYHKVNDQRHRQITCSLSRNAGESIEQKKSISEMKLRGLLIVQNLFPLKSSGFNNEINVLLMQKFQKAL